MTESMRALVYDRAKDPWEESRGLRLEDVPKAELDEKNDYQDRSRVLIKPRFVGFCGSDRGIWFRRAFKDMIVGSLDKEAKALHRSRDQRVIGHELFGEIVAVGSDAKRTHGLEVGDMVAAESHIFCGVCYQCRNGDAHVCADDLIIGISYDGAFADYVKLPAQVIWRTDTKKIRPEVAAIQEPFGNAVHACTKVNLRGKRVAIVGCGTIGLFAVAIARALGAQTIIGIEPVANHAAMARKLGADHVLSPGNTGPDDYAHDKSLVAEVRKLTDGVGVDVALEMSGLNSSVNNAIHCARRGGDVILFGLKSGDAVIESFDRLIVDGIALHSVIGRRIWETWHITRHLLESRDPNIHDLIYDVILNRGDGPIVKFDKYEKDSFEERIKTFPKVVLEF
ncbi:MAG: zinc-binding dehydrogenase [Polyangiaceae bacterium]|nr:zinc-binding dehydrogenase [Polyangiaceae bacterium]MCE7893685.1 theronine dehydrogenase [Sorangiineae bacterium PRO1]MCL4749578.1 zinc-binding dehydrogenase [Myxococcales bacterium]